MFGVQHLIAVLFGVWFASRFCRRRELATHLFIEVHSMPTAGVSATITIKPGPDKNGNSPGQIIDTPVITLSDPSFGTPGAVTQQPDGSFAATWVPSKSGTVTVAASANAGAATGSISITVAAGQAVSLIINVQ
jgi:hypothetical protein